MAYHFTLTGPEAGRPFCDINKQAALAAGDTFAHVSYTKQGEEMQLARPDICPKCKSLWVEINDEETDG